MPRVHYDRVITKERKKKKKKQKKHEGNSPATRHAKGDDKIKIEEYHRS